MARPAPLTVLWETTAFGTNAFDALGNVAAVIDPLAAVCDTLTVYVPVPPVPVPKAVM